MWLEFCILFTVAGFLFYRWAIYHHNFFKDRGIPYKKPLPLLGSFYASFLRKKNILEDFRDVYNIHNGKYFGTFDQRNPVLMIRDPEMVKQITVKDFDHFMNHRSVFVDDVNLFSSSVFFLKDSKWKDMRSTLSPAFTGSKMRQMFELVNQVAQDAVEFMKVEVKGNEKGLDVDFKNLCTRFTNDAIATTAFGIQVNSFQNINNEFYRIGKNVTTFDGPKIFKFFLFNNFKFIMKFLDVSLFDKKYETYFMNLVIDAMKYRKEHNISRPDMINMLMEARDLTNTSQAKAHNREWTDVEIVAQCFLFFFAGFETTAVLMATMAQELMENEDVQQKLYDEIDEVLQNLDGKPLTYEVLQSMKYLDMVMSETLRKWPPVVAIDRVCTKDYVYESDGEKLHIKKGDSLSLPVIGLHYDPKYFENPNKFDPERFSDENKDNIKPFTYLPFGLGPRACIGLRLAQMEAKSLIFYTLRSFRIMPAAKSTIPMVLSKKSFQIAPKDGFWMKLVPRK